MFRIGQFATMSGLTIDTLRHYDAVGILKPSYISPETGYRLYDPSQLEVASRIVALQDAGFSLAEIAEILRSGIHTSELISLLEEKAAIMQEDLRLQQARVDRLLSNILQIKTGGVPILNEVTIKSTQPILVCSIRRVIDRREVDAHLDDMWTSVGRYTQLKGIKRIRPCMLLYHDHAWAHPRETVDMEVAEPVPEPFPGRGEIMVHSLPAVGKMASIVHNGSIQSLSEAYAVLSEWLLANHHECAGPLREIYHVGEWATNDPSEFVTELQVPLA